MQRGLWSWMVRGGAVAALTCMAIPAAQSAVADGGVFFVPPPAEDGGIVFPTPSEDGFVPTPAAVKECTFTNRTPTPGSKVRPTGGAVRIAVSGSCNENAGRVRIFLDGKEQTSEGGGRDEFHFAEFFEAPRLARGLHKVLVNIEGDISTTWSFAVIR